MEQKLLLSYLRGEDDAALFAEADKIRRKVYGTDVYIRGLIEISNLCTRNG